MKVENRDSFKTFFKYRGLQNKNKLLYLTSLKQKNKNRKKIFIYNIKGNKMTMNVFAHEFFAAERAAFAERAFAEFMSRLRA
jgi:hypothetical protein